MIHNIAAITFDHDFSSYPRFTVNLNYCKFDPTSDLGAKKKKTKEQFSSVLYILLTDIAY